MNYDADKVLKYFFDLESTYPDLRAVRLKIGTNVEGKGITIRNDFYDFKDMVRADKMCDAVETIFKKFKGNDNYNKAIAYLIESPDVDRNKKYNCGDAGLEILLK